MRVMMLVEDRETAFLFLDVENAPAESVPFDLTLESVPFERAANEEEAVWLMTGPDKLVVRPLAGFDFANADTNGTIPIPTPLICMTTACMDLILAE